jgi:hypothetical protein
VKHYFQLVRESHIAGWRWKMFLKLREQRMGEDFEEPER